MKWRIKDWIWYMLFLGSIAASSFVLATANEDTGREKVVFEHQEETRQDTAEIGGASTRVGTCERAVLRFYPQFPHGSRYDSRSASVVDSVVFGSGGCCLVEVDRPQVISECRGSCPVALIGVSSIDIWAVVQQGSPERIARGIELRDTVLDVDPIVVSRVAGECGVNRSREALTDLYMTIALADRQTFRSRHAEKPPYWRSVSTEQDLPADARKEMPQELIAILQHVGAPRKLGKDVVAESRCAVSSWIMEDISWEVTCWDFFFGPDGDLVEADLLFNDILGYRINNPYRSPRTGTQYMP